MTNIRFYSHIDGRVLGRVAVRRISLDVACCYRRSSVIGRYIRRSVGRSVTIVSPAKNGWTDRDAVWGVHSSGPKEPCIRWGIRSPVPRRNYDGKERGGFCKV